jgi:probable 2-oxoglutarate dehydrogenase E1 component DHKTD1
MGAWFFAEPRFERILGTKLTYCGRETQACVSGTGSLHAKEVKHVLGKPFEKF